MLITIIIIGLITFGLRAIPILLIGHGDMPPLMKRALRFVPPAVLSAIVAPEVLQPDGMLNLSLANARLLPGLLAILVAWRTRSVLWTIIVGMGTLWLLVWLKVVS